MKPIRVLIINDSALVRQMLTEILGSDPGIEVVGTAADAYMARQKIKRLNPGVLTLDVKIPRMDGITFLRNLIRLRPMPVVMSSSLTQMGAEISLNALESGAVDVVTKPKLDVAQGLRAYGEELVSKVKLAANARIRSSSDFQARSSTPPNYSHHPKISSRSFGGHFRTTDQIIAIGASTGGTEAIEEVLMEMPPDAPGIVIAQHIPEAFSHSFAKRMDSVTSMTVIEASNGLPILPGHVYIAPGHSHLLVKREGACYVCHLDNGPVVNRHRPSVDVLFDSVAQSVGPNAVGVILTGMGADGAKGLLAMLQVGASTIAQDEASSVVWGMPGEAVKLNAAEYVLPLSCIAANLLGLAKDNSQLKKRAIAADR
jgi:two-component system chemotaxis response regulator CheB